MRPLDVAAALTFAVDAAAFAAGAWNAAALLARRATERAPARRAAYATLAAVNAGIAVQAAFAQALYATHRLGLDVAPFFEPAPWVASRALLLAGTLAMSALILRRPRP